MKIILFLVALVSLAILAGMAMLGTNPFATAETFAVCVGIALFFAGLIVGLFCIMFGLPKLEHTPRA
ncbi:MAG: hypothetical protein P4M11_01745 [Candidatus Pacebacteria bacterium]|nr:hypothetical protein [Candidatus Paceibacterota bacterium]